MFCGRVACHGGAEGKSNAAKLRVSSRHSYKRGGATRSATVWTKVTRAFERRRLCGLAFCDSAQHVAVLLIFLKHLQYGTASGSVGHHERVIF